MNRDEKVLQSAVHTESLSKISLWSLYAGNVLWLPVFALTGFGVLFVYSSSSVYAGTKFANEFYFVNKQLMFLLPALCAGFIAAIIPIEFYLKYIKPLFISALLLTLMTHLPFLSRKVGGAARWLSIGGMSIQPAEFLKIFSLLFLVSILTTKNISPKSKWTQAGILMLAPCAIILQKDLGTTLVVFMGCIAILFMNGLAKRYFSAISVFLVSGLIAAIVFEPYRIKRIMTFLNPFKDPLGSGFQIIQSFVAVANGGVFGKGIGESQQKLFFLPEAHTDFILAVIAEEMGFVGVLSLAVLYCLLFYAILQIILMSKKAEYRLVATGIFAVLAFTTIINMGVVAGALPTKGLPLPFISNGGSALIANYFAIGLLAQLASKVSFNSFQRSP